MVSERVRCRAFIGREVDLDHLAQRRRSAAEGRGGLVLVAGEAGIGKSRLLAEYRRRFTNSSSAVVAVAGCRSFAQRPLGPIADVLAQLGEPSPFAGPIRTREEQLEAIFAAIDASARRRLTTLMFEDLHWADVEFIQTLTLLAARAATRRLLVIGTYRDDEILATNPAFGALGQLLRAEPVSQVRLFPLAGADLAAFLGGMLGEVDNVVLPTQTLDDIKRRSAGNPFFAEELTRHAVDAQRSGGVVASRTLPLSLRAVIRERLDRCNPSEHALLGQASVFGMRFRLDLLGEVFGFEPHEKTPSLDRLRELQLVERVEDDALAFEFRHALTRDVIYEEVPREDARRLHAEVGQRISARPDAGRHVELLAHSFWEAGQLERAAPYCEAAAEAAEVLHAHSDAAFWYERAAVAFGSRRADVARVLTKAGVAAVRLHDPARAAELHERAIALHAAERNYERAVWLSTSLAGTLFNDARSDRAFAVLRSALDFAAASGELGLRHRVLIRLLALHAAQRSLREAWACAAEIDEDALDPEAQLTSEFFLTKSSLHAQRGEVDAWRRCYERAITILERVDAELFMLRHAHGSIAVQALNLGEMPTARLHAAAGLALAKQIRSDELYMRSRVTEIELRAGRLSVVRESLREIKPTPEREFLSRHNVASIAARLGAYSGDEEMLRSAVDLELIDEAEAGGNRFAFITLACAFAPALAYLGRREEAASLLKRAAQVIEAPFGLCVEIATICRWAPAEATHLLAVLTREDAPGQGRVESALRALVEATVAAERGDDARARAGALSAASVFAEIGWPLLEAQCRELSGERARALALYRGTGAVAEARRLERPLAVASGGAARGLLTPREREVARLVAGGKDNLAVADALSISRKAVEKYLTSIYGKLGIASRAQLAVFMLTPDAGSGAGNVTG